VARMRESMARLTTQYSANRAVREYTKQHYIPAATAYLERAADKGAVGAQVVGWQHTLEQKWPMLRFGEVKVVSDEDSHIFKVEVYLNSLEPNSVRVELYADGINGGEPARQEMRRGQQLPEENGYIYSAQVPATRPAADYTTRAIPHRSGVAIPLESARILWQR
jgi:starch phosphorylase